MTRHYSQNDEESHIVRHFGGDSRGRFLDIGAFDGLTFSNVRRLLELGWHGVCVEPAPAVLPRLRENLKPFSGQVSILPVAVGKDRREATFYDSNGDGVSTTNAAHRDLWATNGGIRYTTTKVNQITATELIGRYGDDFDFVNIDTERQNVEVVQAMPWHHLTRCRMVCVEHDQHFDAIFQVLGAHGFTELCRNPENLLLTR